MRRGLLSEESGQGVLEYILLLVIVVAIALGGLYQLNDAFRNWATNYFSEYLACIMETGELPAIGGAGITAGECNNLYEPFSIEEGRPLVGGGTSGGGGGAGGGGAGSGGGEGGGNDGEEAVANSGGASKYSAGGGRGGGRSGRFKSSGGPADLGDDDDSKNGRKGRTKKIYTGSTDASIPAYALNGGRGRFKAARGLAGQGGVYSEDEDENENEEKLGAGTVTKQDIGKNEKRNRIRVNKPKKKEELPPDEPMTIGNFLRYLIIAAIIIAIVVFFGGQALQLGKGME